MQSEKLSTVSQVLISAYEKGIQELNSMLEEQKEDKTKLDEVWKSMEDLKRNIDGSGVEKEKLVDLYKEYEEMITQWKTIKKRMVRLTRRIKKIRIKLRLTKKFIQISDYFVGAVTLSIGVLFLMIALDNLTGDKVYSIIQNHSSNIQIMLNGLYAILASLGYLMANKRILYTSDMVWWVFYGILGNIAAMGIHWWSGLNPLWMWLIILSLINFFTLSIRGLAKLLNKQVKDPRID